MKFVDSKRRSTERLMNGTDAKTFASYTSIGNGFLTTKLKIDENKALRSQRSAI
ncbi:unnamed protein product [Cylicostephanus goldi]|uniref:Uncharacterized protein n=1 Tax=Cylicostephanus goldi TaxID=71465 RepID=A0A3P7P5W8_CYLGO|nr:unnamed protein product [Cylicostephanus goldi]